MKIILVDDEQAAYTIVHNGKADTLWRNETTGLSEADILALAYSRLRLSAGDIARDKEIDGASPVARAWFASHQAAADFIRLTPAEQEAAIDAMTTVQLKTLLKYLTVAVAFMIKRELL